MENNEAIFVNLDYGSTGLWVPPAEGDEHLAVGIDNLGNANYKRFKLPKDLVKRFHYWEMWFTDRRPEDSDENQKMDWELFDSFGRALAIDLKRFVGDKHRVIYGYPEYIGGNTNYDHCVEIILVIREQLSKENNKVPMAVPYKK